MNFEKIYTLFLLIYSLKVKQRNNKTQNNKHLPYLIFSPMGEFTVFKDEKLFHLKEPFNFIDFEAWKIRVMWMPHLIINSFQHTIFYGRIETNGKRFEGFCFIFTHLWVFVCYIRHFDVQQQWKQQTSVDVSILVAKTLAYLPSRTKIPQNFYHYIFASIRDTEAHIGE